MREREFAQIQGFEKSARIKRDIEYTATDLSTMNLMEVVMAKDNDKELR